MAQRTTPKKRVLRPPFLITVATLAGSISAACGGAVTGGDNGGSAGDAGNSGSNAGNGGSNAGVTSGSTTGGTAVTGSGTTTGTSGSATVGAGGSGAGGTGMAGNGGDGRGPSCPVTQPLAGSTCANPSQTCDYAICLPGGGSFECVAGRWSMLPTPPGCNPPPPIPSCPAAEPTQATSCPAYQYQLKTCSYPVAHCGLLVGQANYQCASATNSWRKIMPDGGEGPDGSCFAPPASCASSLPTEGAPCCFSTSSLDGGDGGLACYAGDGGFPCYYPCSGSSPLFGSATCEGGRWHVIYGACPTEGGVEAGHAVGAE